MERIIVTVEDVNIGVAYDTRPDKCVLKIGGSSKDLSLIERVANEYFGVDVYKMRGDGVEPKWTQKNKLMFVCQKPRIDFVTGIAKLKEHGITVTEGVSSFGRLMR